MLIISRINSFLNLHPLLKTASPLTGALTYKTTTRVVRLVRTRTCANSLNKDGHVTLALANMHEKEAHHRVSMGSRRNGARYDLDQHEWLGKGMRD